MSKIFLFMIFSMYAFLSSLFAWERIDPSILDQENIICGLKELSDGRFSIGIIAELQFDEAIYTCHEKNFLRGYELRIKDKHLALGLSAGISVGGRAALNKTYTLKEILETSKQKVQYTSADLTPLLGFGIEFNHQSKKSYPGAFFGVHGGITRTVKAWESKIRLSRIPSHRWFVTPLDVSTTRTPLCQLLIEDRKDEFKDVFRRYGKKFSWEMFYCSHGNFFHEIVFQNQYDWVPFLLELGLNVDMQVYRGPTRVVKGEGRSTALFWAIRKNDIKMVKLLLDAGAYPCPKEICRTTVSLEVKELIKEAIASRNYPLIWF